MKLTLVTFVLVTFNLVWADSDIHKYERLKNESQITIVQAIAKAEAYQNGVAISAELDRYRYEPVYEVDILSLGRMYEVIVDGKTGEIKNVREDRD